MLRLGALLLLTLTAGALALPPATGMITESELAPHLKELIQQFMLVSKRKMDLQVVLERYDRLSRTGASKRDQAINAYLLGMGYDYGRREQDALREFQRALQLWPQFPSAHVLIGAAAFRKRDFSRARSEWNRALQLEPNNVAAWIWMADLEKVLGKEENLKRAMELYQKALEIKPVAQALQGLAHVSVQLYHTTFLEEDKKKYAESAIGASRGWLVLSPTDGRAHINMAQVFVALGRYEEAIRSLEKSYSDEQLDERFKLALLSQLADFYMNANRPKDVARTLRRILKHESVTGEARKEFEQRLRDLEQGGSTAFELWKIRSMLDVLKNEGISVEQRKQALRQLLEYLKNPLLLTDEGLKGVDMMIFESTFKLLKRAPPELTVEMFKYFRQYHGNPRLIRILVHFVWPAQDDERTPEVRAESVRTLGEVCGEAAIPTLLYCLREDDGMVLREVDRALSRVCETRSFVGDGIEPLREEQTKTARMMWQRYFQSDEGTALLVKSFEILRQIVNLNPAFNRENKTQPLVDHIINTVLFDDDVQWPAWRDGYQFFMDYMGKDFRPIAERKKELAENQRADTVRELKEWWRD
jgi:tetratricopeptide (TPR) repeat protein